MVRRKNHRPEFFSFDSIGARDYNDDTMTFLVQPSISIAAREDAWASSSDLRSPMRAGSWAMPRCAEACGEERVGPSSQESRSSLEKHRNYVLFPGVVSALATEVAHPRG